MKATSAAIHKSKLADVRQVPDISGVSFFVSFQDASTLQLDITPRKTLTPPAPTTGTQASAFFNQFRDFALKGDELTVAFRDRSILTIKLPYVTN